MSRGGGVEAIVESGSMVDSTDCSRDGVFSLSVSDTRTPRLLDRGEGVFAGEDFCGDIDLARSVKIDDQYRSWLV